MPSAFFPATPTVVFFSGTRKKHSQKHPRLISASGGADSPEEAVSDSIGKSSANWGKHFGVFLSAIAVMVTLWITFVKPSVLAESDSRAQIIVEKALRVSEELRREQVEQIRRSIDRITARLDRVDSTLSSELRAMSTAVDSLSKELRRK